MTTMRFVGVLLTGVALTGGLFAQGVPQLISYQGRVTAAGTNFNGTGQFKFALVNSNGTVTFWSNNGSSAGGGEPNAAVPLPVTNGLVTVLLGHTALPNMTGVPATVFTNSDVRLRLWFDGGSGFQWLAPDQRLAGVGYAMMSANVPDALITAAKLADGAVTSLKLAAGAVTSGALSNQVALGSSGRSGLLEIRNASGTNNTLRLVGDAAGSGELRVANTNGVETVRILAAETNGSGALIQLRKADGTTTVQIDSDFNGDGRVITQELQITGGSDLSEQFDIAAARDAAVRPGMVVCIDPAQPGRLALSTRAYDRTAAGVVSGAGGVKPGMLMGQQGTVADGRHPVALTGRVYCLADAANGPIRPGDLLTTSDTPGHAMKVTDHGRAQGAIIGKAMSGLASGQGLVLVLVSLQ